MKELQKTTQGLISSGTDKEKMDLLSKAFSIFSDDAARLENAYDQLGKQFESLNLELQDANHKLLNKVAELDVITDYLKNILDNIAQGILFIDLNGTITLCNPAAETILEIQRQEMIFQRFWKVFKDDVFGFSMRSTLNLEKAVQDNKVMQNFELESLSKRADHSQKVKAAPIESDYGSKDCVNLLSSTAVSRLNLQQQAATNQIRYTSPLHHHKELEIGTAFALKDKCQNQGLIIMVRDVTEMRRLQVIAARADRMKVLGEMAAQVAHEIRNPLGGIKGFASLLKRDLADNPELQKMASHIVEGTDSLNNLVNQILHYARPVQPHPEKVDLIALLNEMKKHVIADSNIYRPNIAIEINAAFDRFILSVDVEYFKSALLNLLVNAIQAMPKGGTVSFSLSKQPGYAVLSITDNGTGIPEEVMPRLFSPFFTTKPEGNGLGLAEVQKVIQAHGGTIDVASIIDKGTVFTIKLPL